jgi:hypothetical protein
MIMMKLINKQRGIGFVGWSSILAIIACIVLIVLRLFPLYNEKFAVDNAMTSVANRPDAVKISQKNARKYFTRNAQIQGVERFNSQNIKNYAKIIKGKKGVPRKFNVKFEARNKFFDVIYLVLVYDNSVELTGKASSK